MEAEGFEGRCQNKTEDTEEMLQRFLSLLSVGITRLKLSDQDEKETRWTDNMQHSANTYPFSYLAATHPPTMRGHYTSHRFTESYKKQLVLSPEPSAAVYPGAFLSFFF